MDIASYTGMERMKNASRCADFLPIPGRRVS